MKIIFITESDHAEKDPNFFSGTPSHIVKNLKKQGVSLVYINTKGLVHFIWKCKSFWARRIMKTRSPVDPKFDPAYLKLLGIFFSIKISMVKNADLVFSASSAVLPYIHTKLPIVIWRDTTLNGLIEQGYYKRDSLHDKIVQKGHALEKKALNKPDILLLTSSWAAQSAIDNYNVPKDKIKVLPYGGCTGEFLDGGHVANLIASKQLKKFKLITIARNLDRDWQRKGIDISVDVTKKLKKSGIDIEIVILGKNPQKNMDLPDYIKQVGYLDKSNDSERKIFQDLLKQSHFLILPTQGDCLPNVIAEANSYGVPALLSDIGGISSSLKNDINGHLFPKNGSSQLYCDFILKTLSDFEEYKKLALSSYNEYLTRLNWPVIISKVKDLMEELVQSRRRRSN